MSKTSVAELDQTLASLPDTDKKIKTNGRTKHEARKQGRKPVKASAVKGTKLALGTKAKAPFRMSVGRVNEENKYDFSERHEFNDLDDLLKKIKRTIDEGQGNGLHELIVVVK